MSDVCEQSIWSDVLADVGRQVQQAEQSSLRLANDHLKAAVVNTVQQYIKIIGNPDKADIFQFVLDQIEGPLLAEMLAFSRNNQVRSAKLLGISRETLRKKMKRHNML
jgi:Fis family transcriptional regulator